ncbi:MAG: hypothetical protein M3P24_09295, partial [Gemmatimonadota bacterium]|nr:hypothetical protein [Gemmatimonadota bacterium]
AVHLRGCAECAARAAWLGRRSAALDARLAELDLVPPEALLPRTFAGVQRRRAFLWERGTSYDVELPDNAWEIDDVSDLSDAGVILAHAKNTKTGQQGAVLLTPRS